MKLIKFSFFAFIILSLSSCLKSANDFAGLRTDPGQVVTAITEKQYQINDGYNLGIGYVAYAGFSFAAPAGESPRFFALHISQPRTKISGNMSVKITMSASASGTLPPAGAVTIPAEILVPATAGDGFDFPVKLAVNKALLNPATTYAATFTISSVNQGIVSDLEKSVDVVFVNSKYQSRYKAVSTVKDPNGQYGVDNNTKPLVLLENAANNLDLYDPISGSGAVQVANLSTGAATNLFTPRFVIDATTGKVTNVLNKATGTALPGLTIDPTSQFVYNASDDKTLTISYTFNFTSTINGASVTRPISVSEKYTYTAAPQAY